MPRHNKNLGFTLIELLVVIALIGILSTISYVTFQSAQKNGRDRQRMSDLAKIAAVLETYKARYGQYPNENMTNNDCDSSIGGGGANPSDCGSGTDWKGSCAPPMDGNDSDLCDIVSAGLMIMLPTDPINNSTYFYHFEIDNVGQGTAGYECTGIPCRYLLQTLLENGEKAIGGKGQCVYSMLGGSGIPSAWNTTNCKGTIVPTNWPNNSCCKMSPYR